jgi:hypothetical protein
MGVVGERKSFLLRLDGNTLEALRLWADDELRSLNGQVEYLLRRALKDSGRLKDKETPTKSPSTGKG